MFTSAELIEALQRRRRRSIRPLPPATGVPPSWQAWFESVRDRAGPGRSHQAEAWVEVFMLREPSPRPAVELLGGWAAFRALWRQQWEPPPRDERGLRTFSRTASLLLHLMLALALSWLMHARLTFVPDAQRGEHVIEVEFIGSGAPEEDAGGATVELAGAGTPVEPNPLEAPLPAGLQPAQDAVVEAGPAAAPPVETAAPVDQPLAVTETPVPDGLFQLPPVEPAELAPVSRRELEVAPRMRDVELTEIHELNAPRFRSDAPVPELRPAGPAIVERELELPPRPLPAPQVPPPPVVVPGLRSQVPSARVVDIPMPAVADGSLPEDVASTRGEARPADDASGTPVPQVQGRGAGPAQVQREGGWAAPRRGDDWGAAVRDRPGGQRGSASLFNPDGSPRLPSAQRSVGSGLPPGTITEDYEKIDRMGTWLKRPPTDYEPTSLDRFWVPHESLLQEWVRRSVRTVLIPIPGTGKTIRCDVVTLAVVGGCGIFDPNLQDDPASGRPPPDIPFRPELHEDQQGLGDQAWNRE